MTTRHVPIDKVIPNPEQPRTRFDDDALLSLAQSIEVNGLIQPIVVEEADDCYIIHDGERRWRACQLAGRATIEVVIRPALNGTAPRDRLVRALVANVQREDLNPMEEARAAGKLRSMGLTLSQIGEWTGWSHPVVVGRLQLLELEPELQDLVAVGDLPRDPRVSEALLSIPDTETRVRLGKRLARPGVTIKAIVAACERVKEKLGEPPKPQPGRVPALNLLGKEVPPQKTERWQNVRAAAQGMCDKCDANPKLPSLPEPAWHLVFAAAESTCKACSLSQLAKTDLSICRECPGVELLRRMAANV